MVVRVRKRVLGALRTKPYHYQMQGIRFTEKHRGRVLIGDDMGLGKTLQSIGWLAIHPDRRPVVVVCPATLKFNWQRELKTHAGLSSHVCEGEMTTREQDRIAMQKAIRKIRRRKKRYGASGVARRIRGARAAFRIKGERNKRLRRDARKHKILIINYDIVDGWLEFLSGLGIQVLVIDECQMVQNPQAQCTKAVKALSRGVPHVLGLSGTPISGKPIQFFSILNMIRPEQFPSYWKFGMEYGAPEKNRFSGGYTFSGASHLKRLRRQLKDIMIRRLKREVLKDLPEKTRSVLPVEITNRKEYAKAEASFLDWLERKKGKEAADRAARAEAICRINALKFLSARGKLKIAIRWIKEFLGQTNQKLVLFAYHKKILRRLKKEFTGAALIDGSVSSKADASGISPRQREVDRFQTKKDCRLLLGHRRAAGTGLTLTAGTTVLFLEIGWTPGEHEQAEDRCLRIGQDQNVSVYYMVGKDTIEERLLEIIQAKDEVVSAVLDGKKGGRLGIQKEFLRQMTRLAKKRAS